MMTVFATPHMHENVPFWLVYHLCLYGQNMMWFESRPNSLTVSTNWVYDRGISVPPMQYIERTICGGWWLSGCCSSVAEQARCAGFNSRRMLAFAISPRKLSAITLPVFHRLGGPECIQAKSVTLLLVLKSLYLSVHPSQWPAHLSVQHSRLERTSKQGREKRSLHAI